MPLPIWLAVPTLQRVGAWALKRAPQLILLVVVVGGYVGCWWNGRRLEPLQERNAHLEQVHQVWVDGVADRDEAIASCEGKVAIANGALAAQVALGDEWRRALEAARRARPRPTPPPVPAADAVTADELPDAIQQAAAWLAGVLQ